MDYIMNLRNVLKSALGMLCVAAMVMVMHQAEGASVAAPPALAGALAKLPDSLKQSEPLVTDLQVLFASYGQYIRGLEVQPPNRVYLVMRDGQKILYDDGRAKSFEEKLRQADLKDMLSQPYKPGKPGGVTPPDQDPGRIRVGAFFTAVYGATAGQVQNNLVPVNFAGARVSFNGENGAAAALAKVGETLSQALARNPALRAYLFPLGGSYNRRSIAGTDRLSPHSWGIALDLHKGQYWRWGKSFGPMELLALQTSYPIEIIAAFEKQGFVWGGKWYHYDIMHFEYRPELVAKAGLAGPGARGSR
jgi:hypothetical protein